MSEVPIRISRRGAVLEVVIDRPKGNAIDPRSSRMLSEVFAAFRDDAAFRVAVVTGAGEQFFCAGAEMPADGQEPQYGPGGVAGLQDMLNLNKPVIAAVNGLAIGAGAELALAADMVFASEGARFSFPAVRMGGMDEFASIALPRRLPRAVAMEILFSGRWVEAKEAARYGLVNEIVEGGGLMDRVRDVARMLAEGPPLALAAIKEAIRETEDMPFNDAYARLASHRLPAVTALQTSDDIKEGRKAQAEKRKPVWRGR